MKTLKYFVLIIFAFNISILYAQQDHIDSLEKQLKVVTEDTTKVLIMDDLCWYYKYSNPQKSLEYGRKSYQLAKKLNYKKGLSRCLSDLGTVFGIQGEFDSAINYYRKALKIRKEIGNKVQIANALNNIGLSHDYNANYDSALTYYIKALKINEEMQDTAEIAKRLINIGVIYFRLGENEKANEYYFKALETRERLKDSLGIAEALLKIVANLQEIGQKIKGEYFEKQKKTGKDVGKISKELLPEENAIYDSALVYADKAMHIFEKYNDKRNLTTLLMNIGTIHGSQQNFEKALDKFKYALSIQEELRDRSGRLKTLYNIGSIYHDKEEYDKALGYMQSSLRIAKKLGDKEWEKSVYKRFYEIYKAKEEFKKALDYYELSTDLKDSIFNEKKSEQIAEMQTKYQTEKKETQIKLLTKEQQIKDAKLKQNRIFIIAVSGGLILLLILVVVVLRGYRQKQKANMLLRAQKQQILDQNEELKQQKEEIITQRDEIEKQRNQIEEKNTHITDSIRYAMRIQHAILPSNDFISQSLNDFFVLFLPKDIVSGDFYWVDSVGDTILFAAVDCTGHGVPGAFMSIVGSNLLNAAVHEDGLTKPAEILNYLSVGVSATLQKDDDRKVKDGMDLTLCALNIKKMEVEYAGAYNPLIHVRNKEAIQHKVDVYPIGQAFSERFNGYNSYHVQLEKGDTLYVFSDGYQDQFGGPKGKKFMKKRLREMLASISDKPMQEQRDILHQAFEDWKREGNKEQIDDVIVFGVRV